MGEPLVSIIIPVYNGEATISRCLKSVLFQDYLNLEILAVNDGSTDQSLALCRELADYDSRIQVIDQPNAGVSAARNHGLSLARGKYIPFLDCDDWITADATARMTARAEESGCDMVIADFYRVDQDRMELKTHIRNPHMMNRQEFCRCMMDEPADFYYGVLWNKLFRRDMIEAHHLRCDTELSWCEDFLFNLQYIRHAETFCAIQAPVYYYVKTRGSLVSTEVSRPARVWKVRRMLLQYYRELYQSMGMYEENKGKINSFMIAVARDGKVSRIGYRGSGPESTYGEELEWLGPLAD